MLRRVHRPPELAGNTTPQFCAACQLRDLGREVDRRALDGRSRNPREMIVLSCRSPRAASDALERTAPVLRERIYGAITCLSTLLILVRHDSAAFTPSAAAIDLAIGGGALWAASLFADYVSDVSAHGHPSRSEMGRGLRDSCQILEAFALPILLLVLASLGLVAFEAALWAGVWITVSSLGLFALFAARRLPVLTWKRVLLVLVLLALGALVVALKTLAH
jgi:hypothetical protein